MSSYNIVAVHRLGRKRQGKTEMLLCVLFAENMQCYLKVKKKTINDQRI